MHSIETNIHICKEKRRLAAQSLQACLYCLRQNKEAISEAILRNEWLATLRKSASIFPDGWYTPPPHGMGILFGNAQTLRGYTFETLRSPEVWPREDVFFDKDAAFLHAYTSPVDKKTGIIGDFSITVYLGEDPKIKSHLQRCLLLNREIFEYIKVGMSFAEVYQFAMRRLKAYGLENKIASLHDPATSNIGHTIPALHEGWTTEELHLLQNHSDRWTEVKDMIGTKRKFVSPIERTIYEPGMAVTLEPRPTVIGNANIPMCWYHTTVVINLDGTKELLTDFEPIFTTVGMDYMLGL